MKHSIIRLMSTFLLSATVLGKFAIPCSAASCTAESSSAASHAAAEPFVATTENRFRRVVSPQQPMWIVHIDTWNEADPEKIISLIPQDLLPYIVFNISLDPGWDQENQRFERVEYGYEIAKSWLRACAERGVWAMIQPAAGGTTHFPDYDPGVTDYEDTIYGEFFRDYPNFIGFNYCEQFWGFDNYVKGFPVTAEERYIHFAGLLELCNKYGGYLIDSWCGNQWAAAINPIAMISRVPQFEEAARKYSDNFILLEKFTSISYLYDMESLVLGTYLSGYCGNFGIRYDSSGWTGGDGNSDGHFTEDYILATGLSVHLERMILNGATVIDGPELIFVDDFYESDPVVYKNSYSSRNWNSTPQFNNVFVDMYRRIINGAFRIPTREEVIERTKFILINDLESGSDDQKYSIPKTFTEGLYKMKDDGNLVDNHSFYKSTGRYPTLPMAPGFADSKLEAQFKHIIKKSEYDTLWPTVVEKVLDLNAEFAQQYTGDLYAARFENTWITYNPYKKEQIASAVIPLNYNTAESIGLEYNRYTTGFFREYSDHIDIFLNNYNDDYPTVRKTDIITISGADKKPAYDFTDCGKDIIEAEIFEDWIDGVYTLHIKHNGPVDITIHCSGNNKDRMTDYTDAEILQPENPPVYSGTLQHEAELFDTMGVERIVKNGVNENIRNYWGQGYLLMGMKKGARALETVKAEQAGSYNLNLRYYAGGGTIDIYVNGAKTQVELSDTKGKWATLPLSVNLKNGQNEIEIMMEKDLPSKLYIDCFTLDLIEPDKEIK